MKMKGSQTEQNLLKAFAGESQARNRYTYFASKAKKEGFEQIAAIFAETADNEKEHAQIFFDYLEGGPAEITATYPAGKTGSTAENLLAAAEGEKEEWGALYPGFAACRRGRRLQGRRGLLQRDRRSRGAARAPLPQAAGQRGERPGLQAGHRGQVALPQLRLHPRGHRKPLSTASLLESSPACRARSQALLHDRPLGSRGPWTSICDGPCTGSSRSRRWQDQL